MSASADIPIDGEVLEGTKDARRQAVIVLELLTGLRSTAEASEALGCSLARVYQLEARALQGVVTAMEPRPRGRQPDMEKRVADVLREKQALADELARTQALLRTAYRSFGMPASRATGKTDPRPAGKRRRHPSRARKAIARIALGEAETADKPPGADKPAKPKGKAQ